MANFNDDDDVPTAPPLRRVLTSNSQEVLSTFSAINSFGHDTAADVLAKAAELERSGMISDLDKRDVQRILLESGTSQAATHLSTLQQFASGGPSSVAASQAPTPASSTTMTSSAAISPRNISAPKSAELDNKMDLDDIPPAPKLKKVLSNEGRRLLQSIGEGSEPISKSSKDAVPAPIPEKKKKKKKKQSYKDLMAGFTSPTQTDEEIRQAHQAKLASSLGGGQFSKLDKI